jgi:hypothetical protein
MKYEASLIAAVLVALLAQGLCQTASDEGITEDEFVKGAPAYVSYYGDTKCTNIISSTAGKSAMDISVPNYVCDSLQVPGTWQNPGANSEEYDLAIIGGGASGVYMANRLIQVFEENNQPIPKIALLERTQWIGGRLMSARSAGALGLAVNGNDKASIGFPPQEYGGMRIDPYRYRLVFDKIIETGKALYGDDNCLSVSECTEESENCCPDMLYRMEVGNIRYATTRSDLGILGNSSVTTPSQVYSVGDGDLKDRANVGILEESIVSGKGSPYDNCIQLPLVADKYAQSIENSPVLWKDLVVEMCDNCKQAMPGACDLCAKFPGDSKITAPISCLGYDFPVDSFPSTAMLGLLKEVTNADLGTHLYLVREGLQRFLQGLLFKNDTIQVAPIFNKQLTSIGLETGVDAQALSAKQVESIDYDKPMKPEIPSPTTLSLGFADGSVVRAKSAVLTMLPFDLLQIDGLEPWNETLYEIISPGQAVKLVLGWENAEDAPEARLGISSCVSGSCQRIILDGNATDNWMVRQLWLWGPKTVMIYGVAPGNLTDTNKYPANNMINYARSAGMDAMVKKVMDQIIEATGADIPMPTWARIKPWPRGNVNPNWQRGVEFENAATYLERPLGGEVPVFYANSESAPRGEMHGWVQGGWEMVEDSLPELAKYLGLTKDIERYDPKNYEQPIKSGNSAPGESPSSQTSNALQASASIVALLGVLCMIF